MKSQQKQPPHQMRQEHLPSQVNARHAVTGTIVVVAATVAVTEAKEVIAESAQAVVNAASVHPASPCWSHHRNQPSSLRFQM